MRKTIKSLCGMLTLALAFTACYDDEGNYSYHDINEVGIVSTSADKSVAFGDRELNSSIYLSKVYPAYSNNGRTFSSGSIVDRRHIIYYSNVDSATTARLASQLPYIDKALFVLERKNLDYVDIIGEMMEKVSLAEPRIEAEQNQKDFITLFGAIFRMGDLLLPFVEFKGKELISERDLQDYLGRY